jgi:hypothetical protein
VDSEASKYLARSFLLPALGLVAVAALAWNCQPSDWERLVYPGALIVGLAGVFNLNEGFKTWAVLRYGKGKANGEEVEGGK